MEWIMPTIADEALLPISTVITCFVLLFVVALVESRL